MPTAKTERRLQENFPIQQGTHQYQRREKGGGIWCGKKYKKNEEQVKRS